jgi:hypothetical protein
MSHGPTDEPRIIAPRWWPLAAAILALGAACDSGALGLDGSALDAGASDAAVDAGGERFSFFVASLAALQRLSGSQAGFGGDLRFGQADGLSGADEICRQIAESSMPGAGAKGWRAFLSVTKGQDGNPVHAIDRVGEGPWYDRRGRLIALDKAGLVETRPKGAEALIAEDLPNEDGVPNHAPDGTPVDNHDILTGSDRAGRLYSSDWSHTCHDWTSAVGGDGRPRVGHSWTRAGGVGGGPVGGPVFPDGGPRMGGGPPFMGPPPDGAMIIGGGPPDDGGPMGGFTCRSPDDTDGGPRDGGQCTGGPGGGDSWISTLDEAGCAPGVSLIEMGPPDPANPTVGSGGGYGAIYCLALTP